RRRDAGWSPRRRDGARRGGSRVLDGRAALPFALPRAAAGARHLPLAAHLRRRPGFARGLLKVAPHPVRDARRSRRIARARRHRPAPAARRPRPAALKCCGERDEGRPRTAGTALIAQAAAYFARSKRSASITFVQACTKVLAKRSCASASAKASASARSCECEPNTRSARVPVHFTLPVLRSRASKSSCASDTDFHSTPMSRRFTKKSFVS